MDRTNPITPTGFAALRAEYDALLGDERPKLVEVIAWAAGNGDRSENGDYIYGRKRLREIDRRLGFLARRMKAAQVIDPASHEDRGRVWFGATVTLADEDDERRVLTLVGDDETDASAGKIGWSAPIARAVRGAGVGDVRRVTLPTGEREYEVIEIAYPLILPVHGEVAVAPASDGGGEPHRASLAAHPLRHRCAMCLGEIVPPARSWQAGGLPKPKHSPSRGGLCRVRP